VPARASERREKNGVLREKAGKERNARDGQIFVLFVIIVAAAEAAVGLGIIILIARNRQSLNVERVDLLKL